MNERIGDGPIEPEYVDKMRAIAQAIDELFNGEDTPKSNRKIGFLLMVFPFGEGGRTNYMSNATREDVVNLLKEQLARFEGRFTEEGNA